MSPESRDLSRIEQRELISPFPLVRELFDLARERFRDISRMAYSDPDNSDERFQPVALPEKFRPLLAKHPGAYSVVGYENRRDTYYAEGTRFQGVLLSTSAHQYDSNALLREVELTEYEPSEKKGNYVFVRATERVNEEDFTRLNTVGGNEANRPHGSREIFYSLDPNGGKKALESRFSRLDEAMFDWRGQEKPVRWLRDLKIQNTSEASLQTIYKESYLIGRDQRGMTEEIADIKITTHRDNNVATSVLVEIGSGPQGRVLFDDQDSRIRVVINDSRGIKVYEHQEEILAKDPTYSILFQPAVRKEDILKLVEARVGLLENDWNKSQPVFGRAEIESSNEGVKQIE